MTKIELEMVVTAHTYSDFSTKAIMTAVDAYTAASNGAKPIVSGSLQCEHLPMIDTGVGYYHCPSCGWSKKVGGNDR